MDMALASGDWTVGVASTCEVFTTRGEERLLDSARITFRCGEEALVLAFGAGCIVLVEYTVLS
jgi:hypothetical protein